MNALQLFIRALEERLNTNGTHRGSYILKQNVEIGTFKAYKTYIQEVWLVDGDNKQLVAKAEVKARTTNDDEKNDVLESLYYLTIMEVLKYYGI